MSSVSRQQARGILAIWNDCAAGRDADYEAWFQEEHLTERLAVPGFLFGRRHEALSGTPRSFALYVTESVDTLISPPYLERLNNPTPRTAVVMSEVFKNMSRTLCRRERQVGGFRGSTVVTCRFSAFPDASDFEPLLSALHRDPGVARAELWRAAEPVDLPMSEEERRRGGDRRIDGCLAVETLRERAAERIAADLTRQFAGAETGVYRALCSLGNGEA